MTKRILAFDHDLSGINPFMYDALRHVGWEVASHRSRAPMPACIATAMRTLRPSVTAWRRRYHGALQHWMRSDRGLATRTEYWKRILRAHGKPDDIILTFGVMFDATLMNLQQPHVIFRDYTAALALRGGSTNQNDTEAWVAREAAACRAATTVLTASENTRQSIIVDYDVPSDRVVCVGEGLCFREMPTLPATKQYDENTVLFVGKDFHRKGGDVLLAAFEQVRRVIEDATLIVVGPPSPAQVPNGVEWIGPVTDRGVLRECYARSTVFAMPSRVEPFGLVFLEAMAHGLPCIAARRDAMPEIIDDEVTGLLVASGNVEDLAKSILRLLQAPDRARTMGALGYQRVCDRFLWSHVAARMDVVFQRIQSTSVRTQP